MHEERSGPGVSALMCCGLPRGRVDLRRRSAYAGAAHLLCEMGLRLQTVGLTQVGSSDLSVTQAELADAFSLSASTSTGSSSSFATRA